MRDKWTLLDTELHCYRVDVHNIPFFYSKYKSYGFLGKGFKDQEITDH